MLTFIDHGDTLERAGEWIPKRAGNASYADALRLVDAGQAEIVAFAPALETQKAAKVAAINAKRDEILAAGAPAGGRRIRVDDGARADIGGMGATALAAIVTSGAVAWPESYALGWIAIDNERVPLATPADGLAFGASIGAFYGQAVQNARTLKDQALAAESVEDLDAIDLEAGWPG